MTEATPQAPESASLEAPVALSAPPAPSGRLAILSGLSAALAAIPLPILPERAVVRIRGALVHDIAARYGLSLTSDARSILASSNEPPGRALARKAAALISRRVLGRAGPLAILGSALAALEVYALGHLFERYLREVRPTGTVRIGADEARRIRSIADRASARALAPTLLPTRASEDAPPEDLRDELTRWIDSLVLASASLPGYVERRLDQAFEEVLAEGAGSSGS